MRYVFGILLFLSSICLGACISDLAEIEIRDAWARSVEMMGEQGEGEMGSNGAAYLVIKNRSNAADKLLRVESDISQAVELHISEMKDDVMSMHPIEYVEIPARGQIELKPGGMHIMLINLNQDLAEGDMIGMKLIFEQADAVTVDFEVRGP